MKRGILLIAAFICFACTESYSEIAGTELDDRTVQIIVTYQTRSEVFPWQGLPPKTKYGYGVFIDDTRLITTESLVRNHHVVELTKARSGTKIQAKVVMSDPQVNLALLTIDEPLNGDRKLGALDICDTVPRGANVNIVQFDETSEIQHITGKVLQTKMSVLPDAPYSALSFNILANVDVNGDGVGVLYNGSLAGIMMSYYGSSRTGSMIPYLTIKMFLDRYATKPYPGFAHAGFRWKSLLDPAKRKYLGIKDADTGILVLSCLPGTGAFDALKPQDIIIEWDGHKMDNLGFYNDPDFGRITISHLIKNKRKPNDVVKVKVIRDKKTQTVDLKLCYREDSDSLIPENVTGDKSDYIVEGGLVIREVTGSYLKALGSRWQQRINARLVSLYYDQQQEPDETDKRVVILMRVLPDPINIGYQALHNMVITHVNGKEINNLNDVADIAAKDGSIYRLTTDMLGVDIVLDKDALPEANRRIADNYRIPDLNSLR
ncbi:hypothetical protein BVX97_05165 [bacterium E08(2017)]|nr:hypothetical protein BVX97_05165 [bacterium E08(2017)]